VREGERVRERGEREALSIQTTKKKNEITIFFILFRKVTTTPFDGGDLSMKL